MAELTTIREALAENLSQIRGVAVSAYMLSNPTPPAIEVQPGPIDYDRAMARGLDEWTFTVRAFVAASSDKGAQKRLDRMLASTGTDSVKAAVESDPTLGGAADDLRVTRCTGYRLFSREGAPTVIGAEWEVQVFATGD